MKWGQTDGLTPLISTGPAIGSAGIRSVAESELRCAEVGGQLHVRNRRFGWRLLLLEQFHTDVARRDLAQGNYGRLVVLPVERRLRAVGEPPGPLCSYQDELKQVFDVFQARSEEHTSELQSLRHLVCRL